MKGYKITIFTPTYNRAYTLATLYESLLKQKEKDFEWIIVDDGSTDNTQELVSQFIQEKKISIKYIKQQNRGKHVAVNKGLEIAKGELFFVVDSDDYLTKDAINEIIDARSKLKNIDKDYCGIAGLKLYPNGKMIGKTFKGEYIDTYFHKQYKYNIKGDKSYVFFTEIFKQYPYPVFDGEKHTAPSVSMVRMSKDGYKIRHINKKICICEYLEDGLTKQGNRKLINNFEAYTLRNKELICLDIPVKRKLAIIAKYFHIAQIKNISLQTTKEKLQIKGIYVDIIWIVIKLFNKFNNYTTNK